MKKIFTTVLAMGILSFTFAQSGDHRQQNQNQYNGYQQTNSQGYSYSTGNAHNSDRQYGSGNAYTYNNDRDGRGYRRRDFRDKNNYYAPQYNDERFAREDYVQPRFPLLQVVLGIGRR